MFERVKILLKIQVSGLLPARLERMRRPDLFFSSSSWWRQLTWIPGKTMLLAFIPTVCWLQERLPIFVPSQQASNSYSPASPATSSCCPSGLGLRSSEITSCVQVWGKKLFYWTTFYFCVFFFKHAQDVFLQICCALHPCLCRNVIVFFLFF